MTNFNRVILMGRLTRDPKLVYTPANFPICKFRLAVNRSCKDQGTGQWKKEADYFNVDVGGPRGEAFAKYHSKGSLAFVSGELRYRQWEDKKTAMKREAVSVWVDDWQFVEALSPVPVPQQIEDEQRLTKREEMEYEQRLTKRGGMEYERRLTSDMLTGGREMLEDHDSWEAELRDFYDDLPEPGQWI